MKKLVMGMSVAALMASAAWAQDQDRDTKVAAVDEDAASFSKLDSDSDGRVSAIEAATDAKVAAGFTEADANKDGYLSRAEFQSMSHEDASGSTPGSSPEPTTPTAPPTQ